MADPERRPDAQIPDVKKVAEQKQAPFVWSAGGGVARAAASTVNRLPPEKPTLADRLKSPLGLAALLGLLLLGGGGLFALTALGVGESSGGVAGGDMPGSKTRRAFRDAENRMLVRGGLRDDARKDRMQLEAIAAAEKKAGAAGVPEGVVPEEPEEEGAPMVYDRDSGAAQGTAAAAAAVKKAGAAGDSGPEGSAPAAPRLSTRLEMRGMRSVSSNAGFRGLRSGRAIARTISSRGATPGRAGGSGAEYGSGNAATSDGGLAGAGSGPGLRASATAEGDEAASGQAGAGGGGGGGSGPGELGELPETPQERIERLMREAAELDRKADKEERYAKAQAAGGHMGPAHYHYERAKKYRDQSKQRANEAQQAVAETHQGIEEAVKPVLQGGSGGSSQGGGTTP